MSFLITTRNPEQCRTHHQKMIKYHGSIEAILNHGRREPGPVGVEMRRMKKEMKEQKNMSLREYTVELEFPNSIKIELYSNSILEY